VPAPQDERYEPLPGLLQLPSFLYGKLGPSGRIAVKVGGAVLVVAVAAAAVVLMPRIAESNRERSAQERRDAAAALAEQRRRLTREQSPHRARAGPDASRAAVLAELRAGILADARGRAAVGELPGPAARRVECKPLTGADAGADRVPYDCIAVTSDLPSGSVSGVIGHPFRAVVNYSAGRVTWCKTSGRAAEGSLTSEGLVKLPRACSR